MSQSIWAVTPCFNRTVDTLRFLEKISEQTYQNLHVVVVDDGSSDNTSLNTLLNFPNVHIVRGNGSLWWAGGTNLGSAFALDRGAEYIFTINDDSQFDSTLISTLYDISSQDPKYIVGSVIVEENNEDTIWSLGSSKDLSVARLMKLNFSGENIDILRTLQDPYPVNFMPGNGVLIPRGVFESVGYYDEVNFPQYHADSELILRASKMADFKPVISLRSKVINQILTEPLVEDLASLIFNKKSDLYWPALSTLFLRYYPEINIKWIFERLYGEFLDEETSRLISAFF